MQTIFLFLCLPAIAFGCFGVILHLKTKLSRILLVISLYLIYQNLPELLDFIRKKLYAFSSFSREEREIWGRKVITLLESRKTSN